MWYNSLVAWILRSPLHWVMSGSTLLLSYTGRKSGQTFTFPISYGINGNEISLITHQHKTWWKNINAGGLPVTVRVRGQERRGVAHLPSLAPEARLKMMLHVYKGMPPSMAERQLPNMVAVTITLE